MISGIADLYILLVGMLYPSYMMLQQRKEVPESGEVLFWKEYFIMFSIFYVGSEILVMSLQMMIPLITLIQIVGVSCMVSLPLTTRKIYLTYVIPFYEKHEMLITETINDNIVNRNIKRATKYIFEMLPLRNKQ